MGFNAHAANVVAAMFIACGQDAAHAIDGSTCITTVDLTESGVYVAVTLPSLPVGTVGGGTGVETQQECLRILGVAGSGNPAGTNARKLAEIIGAGVLAGELSLLGALAAQHLARAHQQLRPRLKPEPLHHHEGIFPVGVIAVDLKDFLIAQRAVKPLCSRIGYPHFQLDTRGKLERELVLEAAQEESPDSPLPVQRSSRRNCRGARRYFHRCPPARQRRTR